MITQAHPLSCQSKSVHIHVHVHVHVHACKANSCRVHLTDVVTTCTFINKNMQVRKYKMYTVSVINVMLLEAELCANPEIFV